MWGVLDQLERTRRKEKKKGEVAKKVQRNCKVLLYWMCIKFFRSLTTDIYSLALPSPSRLRQTYYLTKKKRLSKNKLLKDYNRIVRILVEFGLPSFFLTSSATLYRPITRMSGSASSWNIPLVHQTRSIGRFQSCTSFGFFQIDQGTSHIRATWFACEFSFYRVYLSFSYRAYRCGFVQIYSKVIEFI